MRLGAIASSTARALLVLGLFASPAQATLRVVTFNTAMGLRGPTKVRQVFEDEPALARAQIVSLQELCLNEPQQLAVYLELMEKAHGRQFHFADYASRSRTKRCDKGQAIVSAYPIQGAGTVRLPTLGADRVCVWVDLSVALPGQPTLRLYNVHLSNRAGANYVPRAGRVHQAAPIIEHALQFMRAHPGAPVLVTGDFNALGRLTDPSDREPMIREFERYFLASQASFQSTFIVPYQLDWIFYANLELLTSRSLFTWLSDHRVAVAEFRV